MVNITSFDIKIPHTFVVWKASFSGEEDDKENLRLAYEKAKKSDPKIKQGQYLRDLLINDLEKKTGKSFEQYLKENVKKEYDAVLEMEKYWQKDLSMKGSITLVKKIQKESKVVKVLIDAIKNQIIEESNDPTIDKDISKILRKLIKKELE